MPSLKDLMDMSGLEPETPGSGSFNHQTFMPFCLLQEDFILRARFELARSIVNDYNRVLRLIPTLYQKKFSGLIRSKGYSPTDLN